MESDLLFEPPSEDGAPPAPKTEKCLIGNEVLDLPVELIEDTNVFNELLSQDTWQNALSDTQQRHLMKFLPNFPQNDVVEKQETMRQLFSGQNFHFGNPLEHFHEKLKDGMYSPDVHKYSALYKKARVREYQYQQHVYYTNLIKEILISRQKILSRVSKTGADEPLQLDNLRPPVRPKSVLPYKARKLYYKIVREINDECGAEGTSSEEEETDDDRGSNKTRKQLFKPTSPETSTEFPPSRVQPTFAQRPHVPNGDMGHHVTSPRTLTDDDMKDMLRRHRKRRADTDPSPDLDTGSLTLQDIITRVHPNKRLLGMRTGNQDGAKKKLKGEKKKKSMSPAPAKGATEDGDMGEGQTREMELSDSGDLQHVKVKREVELPHDENAMDNIDVVDFNAMETKEAVSHLIQEPKSPLSSASMASSSQYTSYFALLRDLICEENEDKISTNKLEEKVREWQEHANSSFNPWLVSNSSWVELVLPALKFLCGDVIGLMLENFVPLLDYKERAQQWKWIGHDRDSSEELAVLCQHWLLNKDDALAEPVDGSTISPPPPRVRTSYTVKPSSDEEKVIFRKQELLRFQNPHQAFTFHVHGYDSVVGPVKGVYTADNQMTKAREHALLVGERPAFVTILTLVRDAAARLPNGEGTRSDICELLRDSQFMSPSVSDNQLNTVVSGALDRLHYEKDPCVKYDVNRKLWIYLHRNRTEEEFERIHLAQGAAAKARKALAKPKPSKKFKETLASVQGLTAQKISVADLVSGAQSPISVPESPSSSQAASPRTPHQSPRTSHGSPRASQASPKISVLTGAQTSPAHTTSPRSNALAAAVASILPPAASPKSLVPNQPQVLTAGGAKSHKTAGRATAAHAKTVPVTFLTNREGEVRTATAASRAATANPLTPQTLIAGNKPMAFSLIQAGAKVKDVIQGQPKTVVLTSRAAESSAQVLATSSQGQGQILQAAVSNGQVQLLTAGPRMATGTTLLGALPRTSLATQTSAAAAAAASNKPVVAKLMQHINSQQPQQVVAVTNVASPSTGQKVQPQQAATTFKIQGSNILHHGGKPMTLQRAQSVEGSNISVTTSAPASATPAGQTLLQRLHSFDSAELRQFTMATDPVVTVVTCGQPGGKSATQQQPQQVSVARGGKPSTLLLTKPGGKPTAQLAGNETVAQLIQTSIAAGGKPAMIGGKPVLIGGKPAVLSGKPLQIGGKPVQLIGKGGQIVSLQGQAGVMSALSMVTQVSTAAGSVNMATSSSGGTRFITAQAGQQQAATATVATPTLVSQILQQSTGCQPNILQHAKASKQAAAAAAANAPQAKIVMPEQGGIMMAQLPQTAAGKQGGIKGGHHPKILTTNQAGLLGQQILVQQPGQGTQGKLVTQQQLLQQAAGRPAVLAASQGQKGAHNIQVVKTMLSQQTGKPAQTTIVLAQPGGQAVTATGLTAEQLQQAGVRPVQAGKGKSGPVYARIITPPSNIGLTAMRPGQISAVQGMSVLQAVGQLQGENAAQILTQLPMATNQTEATAEDEHK